MISISFSKSATYSWTPWSSDDVLYVMCEITECRKYSQQEMCRPRRSQKVGYCSPLNSILNQTDSSQWWIWSSMLHMNVNRLTLSSREILYSLFLYHLKNQSIHRLFELIRMIRKCNKISFEYRNNETLWISYCTHTIFTDRKQNLWLISFLESINERGG